MYFKSKRKGDCATHKTIVFAKLNICDLVPSWSLGWVYRETSRMTKLRSPRSAYVRGIYKQGGKNMRGTSRHKRNNCVCILFTNFSAGPLFNLESRDINSVEKSAEISLDAEEKR